MKYKKYISVSNALDTVWDSLRCDKSVKEEKNYGSKRERDQRQ